MTNKKNQRNKRNKRNRKHQEDFLSVAGRIYEKVLSERNNEDYVFNPPQMEKYLKVVEFFVKMADECNGKIQPLHLEPKATSGGVTAEFLLFDVFGDMIPRFSEIITYLSAISIDNSCDGVCVSVTVPDVFIHKDELMTDECMIDEELLSMEL